ncbi:MAG: MCP four helix bundle domain-containing protein [Verrucomicrobia bacterium]|nr:MCP four helix bundle domain-containing protein [Verrucomicrobiota bacterium]
MNWFKNLKTSVKLSFGFGLIIALLAMAVAAGYSAVTAIRDSQKALFEEDFASVVDLTELRADQNRQRARMLEMAFTTNRTELDRLAQDIRSRVREIDDSLRKFSERRKNEPEVLRKLEELKTLISAYRQTRDTQMALILEGKTEEALRTLGTVQNDRVEKMRAISMELGNDEFRRAEARLSAANLRANQFAGTFVMAGGLAVLVAVVMTAMLTRIIARPLQEITAVAERITVGDLSLNVSADERRDEVGVLARTFDRMTQSLRAMAAAAEQIAAGDLRVKVKPQSDSDLLGVAFARMVENLQRLTTELREGVNVLASAASEISASTSQLAASASETATAVAETTTTVEEVRQTAQLASQKAKAVSDTAQRAAQISHGGRRAIDEAGEGMKHIRQQMDGIAESMVRLSEQNQAIGQIISTVEDLAAQSNLLAVNAAIEAAKAGEQGKGFSVVAQEVRSLAEQSKQATSQVRAILNDVQKATSAAAIATEQGAKAVEAGTKQSAQAGESIVTLAGSVSEAAQSATQIAASSQQQLVGVDQVATAMESIKLASRQNVDGAKQLETAARNLSELGQRLRQSVERYKL